MKKNKIEKHYRHQARDIVDLLHDSKFINEDVTRQQMRVIQDYIAYIIQSSANRAVRLKEFTREVRIIIFLSSFL